MKTYVLTGYSTNVSSELTLGLELPKETICKEIQKTQCKFRFKSWDQTYIKNIKKENPDCKIFVVSVYNEKNELTAKNFYHN